MIVYRELSTVEKDLGLSAGLLYAVSNHRDAHYRKAALPKKDGGVRELLVPDPILALIQRRILAVLLQPLPVSPYATAYRPGHSLLAGARPHCGAPLVLKLDIRHFFDSILYKDVKDAAFPAERYAEPLRILLSLLCYGKDSLPQGAPTSPAISNLVMREPDRLIGAFAEARSIRYTRYCDDMTFSGDFDPDEVIAFVKDTLAARGFFLNEKKTRCQYAQKRQTVTGLVVNSAPALPVETRRALRQELYYCKKFGIAGHLARLSEENRPRLDKKGEPLTPAAYRLSLLGRVNYALTLRPHDASLCEAHGWLLSQKV